MTVEFAITKLLYLAIKSDNSLTFKRYIIGEYYDKDRVFRSWLLQILFTLLIIHGSSAAFDISGRALQLQL